MSFFDRRNSSSSCSLSFFSPDLIHQSHPFFARLLSIPTLRAQSFFAFPALPQCVGLPCAASPLFCRGLGWGLCSFGSRTNRFRQTSWRGWPLCPSFFTFLGPHQRHTFRLKNTRSDRSPSPFRASGAHGPSYPFLTHGA